jgi:hypothetical protein
MFHLISEAVATAVKKTLAESGAAIRSASFQGDQMYEQNIELLREESLRLLEA